MSKWVMLRLSSMPSASCAAPASLISLARRSKWRRHGHSHRTIRAPSVAAALSPSESPGRGKDPHGRETQQRGSSVAGGERRHAAIAEISSESRSPRSCTRPSAGTSISSRSSGRRTLDGIQADTVQSAPWQLHPEAGAAVTVEPDC